MPHKKSLTLPRWIEDLDDPCLETTVIEALVARDFAVRFGAERHPSCKATLRAADATLDQIAERRIVGQLAWKRAADALRKYTSAAECAHPTRKRA